jgi:Holliday junction DNA helicase RuvA
MIARLRGQLLEKGPQFVVVDCGGVGYHAFVSLTTFCRLPEPGAAVDLVVVTNLRENALELFAFRDAAERDMFQLLRSVSGIGPRLALSILSGIGADELSGILAAGDVDRLVAVPGVGKKTAERVLVELKGRVAVAAAPGQVAPVVTDIENDAVAALVGLGYKPADARKAVTASASGGPKPTIEDLIKRSLARLAT